jgi:hypothetical protein
MSDDNYRKKTEQGRWRTADIIGSSPRTCWTDLCWWVINGYTEDHGFEDVGMPEVDGFKARQCRQDSLDVNDSSCYCGKFRNGRVQPRTDTTL